MKTEKSVEEVLLDDRLCLALYAASRAMTARYRPILSRLSLTYPQYLVMVFLWELGPATLGDIGERLHLESSTLSPMLKRLEALNLVTRRRNPEDERSVTVDLTERGRSLKSLAISIPAEIGEAVGLSDSEQRQLVIELRALAGELNASLLKMTPSP